MRIKRCDRSKPRGEKRENPLRAGWVAKGIHGPKGNRPRAKKPNGL